MLEIFVLRLSYQGQCCCAGTRIFVEEKIYDDFVHKSVIEAKKRVLGNPFDPRTEQGPQIDGTQMGKIIDLINSGQKEGARMMNGGGQEKSLPGYYVQPTVFADVTDDMRIAKEEVRAFDSYRL
jgi:aldehyde dehydrogenase (NAD+)